MRDRLSSDRGAVAIIVAILVVLLAGMAAFATDFGIAYANKRNLQKAADAAALQAAGQIIRTVAPTADCASISSAYASNTNGFATALQSGADAIATANTPQSHRTAMSVACSSDNKRVDITYSNEASTATIFGGLFGVSSIYAARSATADIFAATSGSGLRPYALCTADATRLLAAAGSTTQWVRVDFPNAVCGHYSGNWYMLNCPGDQGNGSSLFATNTQKGCKSDVGVIPQWDSALNPLPYDPTIKSTIVSQCAAIAASTPGNFPVPADCLMSNPGNCCDANTVSAWNSLLARPAILLPVFDPTWNDYATTAVAGRQCKNGGDNGCYPIQALASVKVCGFHWGNGGGQTPQYSITVPDSAVPGDPCYGLLASAISTLPANQNSLWLALTSPLQVQGSSGPGGVAVGGGYGAYGTRLIK